MALYLLDSDIVIDYFKGMPSAASLVERAYDQEDVLCLCGVVIAEVYSGLSEMERGSASGFIGSCRFLDTPWEAAVQAGNWRYRYGRQGSALATTDMLVAATALVHDAIVVTGNVRDYPMQEVVVVSGR